MRQVAPFPFASTSLYTSLQRNPYLDLEARVDDSEEEDDPEMEEGVSELQPFSRTGLLSVL
jgi:hypothetical protein